MNMVKCSAPNCCNATYNSNPQITFHRFPKDEYLKKEWLDNMKRPNWQPSSCSVLCSVHFERNLIDKDGFRTVLLHGAVPTIFVELEQANKLAENIIADLKTQLNKAQEENNKLKNKVVSQSKKIKLLKQKNRRLHFRVLKISDVINHLREKEKIDQDELHILSGIKVQNIDFFARFIKKAKGSILAKTYFS